MDEQQETQEQQQPAVAQPAVPAHHGQTFVVSNGALDHERVVYKEGTRVPGSLFGEAEFKTLRKLGVLKYETELAAAEDVAQQLAEKNEALAEAHRQLEQVRQQLEQAQKSGRGK